MFLTKRQCRVRRGGADKDTDTYGDTVSNMRGHNADEDTDTHGDTVSNRASN